MNATLKAAIGGLSVIGLCTISLSAQAVTLVNGDFSQNNLTTTTVREQGIAANPSLGTGSSGILTGTATATGWSFGSGLNWLVSMGNAYRDNLNIQGGRGDGTQQMYGSNPILNPIVGSPDFGTTNGFYVVADGDPGFASTITQTVSGLTPGQLYAVSFYQAAGQQRTFEGGTIEQFAVNLGSTVLTTSNYTTAGKLSRLMSPIQPYGPGRDIDVILPIGQTNTATAVSPWQQETLTFTADAASTTLSFLAVGLPGGKPPFSLLTGVSVNAVPAPEPFTIIGTIVGGAAALGLKKKLKSDKNT
jgi:hypothetical protein